MSKHVHRFRVFTPKGLCVKIPASLGILLILVLAQLCLACYPRNKCCEEVQCGFSFSKILTGLGCKALVRLTLLQQHIMCPVVIGFLQTRVWNSLIVI